jgi:protocatechuate 3,4-dioxygenase beta subunit
MRKDWIAILLAASIIVTLADKSHCKSSGGEQAPQIMCSGTVVDAQGRPIAGGEVTLYVMKYTAGSAPHPVTRSGVSTTTADGAFSFSASANSDSRRYGYIVAEKRGMAFGFAGWVMRQSSKELEIKLGEPHELAGIVADENDNPVSGAEVSITVLVIGTSRNRRGLGGPPAMGMFTSTTDRTGRFRFTRIPADATAEFVLKKAGRATVNTYRSVRSPDQKLKYAQGQSGIKLTLPPEARIEGTIVEGSSGKPLPGVKVVAKSSQDIISSMPTPVAASDDNGKFSMGALIAETYVLGLAQPSEGPADWIAPPMEVTTEAGKTKSGIKIELHKGGLFEAVVTETSSKEPVERARIRIRRQGTDKNIIAVSDKSGIAGARLMPGEYQIRNIRKDGYSSHSSQWQQDEIVTMEEGRTTRVERQYTELPRIAGVVRDEKGNPVQGAKLRVCPMETGSISSGARGRFQLNWDPKRWYRSETPVMILLGQYEQGNLAAAVEINKDTRTQDIILRPALTVTGRVIGPDGKGITNAQTTASLRESRWRQWSPSIGRSQSIADEEGRFEIRTLPTGSSYTLTTTAEGYGENRSKEINANDAVNNKLDIGDVTLAVADLSVSGVVVSGGRPVVGASVSSSPIYGNDQPRRKTQTGADGKFLLDGVCAGKIQVSGYKSGAPTLYGFVSTEGGATDIKIEIWALSPPANRVAKQPPSLVRKPLPELKDLKVGLSPANTAGKMMLVCFLDIEQRPSRNCLRQLNAKAQELKAKGVVVAAVQASKIDENSLDEWRKRYDISFPLGMVQGDQEKARFTWGVRSLPWLILTDGRHVVTAEGFGLSELDGEIEQTDGD